MTVRYIETYETPVGTFGIEDHADGKGDDQHFFHADWLNGFKPRFACWKNGCGIGHAATLDAARQHVAAYMAAVAFDQVQVHRRQLCEAQATLENAGNLQLFRVQP